MRLLRSFRRLRADRRGTTLIEFAALSPVLLLMIMGAIESAYLWSVRISLEGALNEAARNAKVAMAQTEDQRDAVLRAMVARRMASFVVENGKTLTITTKVFNNIGDSYPEAYDDANHNNSWDLGESFDDRNRNGVRDNATVKPGKFGDLGDVVVLNATFPARRLFTPLAPIFGAGGTQISASAIMRNEADRTGPVPGGATP